MQSNQVRPLKVTHINNKASLIDVRQDLLIEVESPYTYGQCQTTSDHVQDVIELYSIKVGRDHAIAQQLQGGKPSEAKGQITSKDKSSFQPLSAHQASHTVNTFIQIGSSIKDKSAVKEIDGESHSKSIRINLSQRVPSRSQAEVTDLVPSKTQSNSCLIGASYV